MKKAKENLEDDLHPEYDFHSLRGDRTRSWTPESRRDHHLLGAPTFACVTPRNGYAG